MLLMDIIVNFLLKKLRQKVRKRNQQKRLKNVEKTYENFITNNTIVFDIGACIGTITKFMLNKAKKIIMIEARKKLCLLLAEEFKDFNKIEVLNYACNVLYNGFFVFKKPVRKIDVLSWIFDNNNHFGTCDIFIKRMCDH